jgi:hypothetical protein
MTINSNTHNETQLNDEQLEQVTGGVHGWVVGGISALTGESDIARGGREAVGDPAHSAGTFTAASYRGSALTTVGVQPDVSGVNPGPNRGFTSTFNRQRKPRRRVYVSFWGAAEVHGRTASAAFDANDPKRS